MHSVLCDSPDCYQAMSSQGAGVLLAPCIFLCIGNWYAGLGRLCRVLCCLLTPLVI